LLKETNSLPLPKIEGDDRAQARALSIIYSHPVWMVRRWIRFHGKDEAIRLMNWNNSDPRFSLRFYPIVFHKILQSTLSVHASVPC